ncbi:MAG TPA: glycosyltransferase family 2 protein [Bacteriovoracaceae bacterium]|nr:glycosyltransferase family 2 protein [Bacteriovoracaceae bacterium]
MYDIVLSVVTYNNPVSMLDGVVKSARKTALKLKIVFVDNSNNQQIREYCLKEQVDYLLPESNIGFGSAHNFAMREYSGLARYFLVCNPDIEIHPGALEKLTGFMDKNPEVSLSAPLVVNPDGTIQYVHKRLPAPHIFLARRFFPAALKKLIKRELDLYELKDQDFKRPIEVPSMSGCFMFFRSEAIQRIGGFDPRYFMYAEDIDITREAAKVGRTVLFPDAKVTHLWARGSYFNLKLMLYNIHSIYLYFTKWGPDSRSEIKEYPCQYQ